MGSAMSVRRYPYNVHQISAEWKLSYTTTIEQLRPTVRASLYYSYVYRTRGFEPSKWEEQQEVVIETQSVTCDVEVIM